MNNYIIVLSVMLTLVLTSCWAENSTEDTATWFVENQSEINKNIDEENNEIRDNMSLSERFYANQIWSLKCTLTTENEWGTLDQILYISGIRMRSISTVQYNGQTTKTNMISDGEYTYIWWDVGAFKMKVEDDYDDLDLWNDWEEDEEEDELWESPTDLKTILEQIPDNKCVEWDVDEAMFELPENIEFQDFSDWFQMWWFEDIEIEWYENIEDMPSMDELKNMIPEE
jgi:hypothetical protein